MLFGYAPFAIVIRLPVDEVLGSRIAETMFALLVGPSGDAPAWALAATLAVFGVVGDVAGYVVVAGGRLTFRWYRER